MQTAKQISVRLVNKPGRLATILAAMAKEKVDLLALSVMDSTERSVLRFVPDDPQLARSALDTLGVAFETADVLLVDLSTKHGSLGKVCERLAAEHLNIDYVYGSTHTGRVATAVIKVNDLAKAQRVLGTGNNGARERVKPVRRRPARAR